tara:strand:- start:43 stop:222 length:180 start_codon:yes stop_codon:yes gene_type:complete
MNNQEKFRRALIIEKALCELMDEETADCYEILFDHLGDFINDLRIDLQNNLNTDELFLK